MSGSCDCCGSETPKLSINNYFSRALRRERDQLPPIEGDLLNGADRLFAQFYLDVEGDRIDRIEYKCTTCVVLVAYCERLAEIVSGVSTKEALEIEAVDLVNAFPDVPEYRQDRSDLAVRALRSALSKGI